MRAVHAPLQSFINASYWKKPLMVSGYEIENGQAKKSGLVASYKLNWKSKVWKYSSLMQDKV